MTDTERCQHCGDHVGRNVLGLCDSCFRKSTVLFSQTDDGTYQCSLCALAQRETRLAVEDRLAHLRECHDVKPGNRLQTIREYERLAEGIEHRQVGLGRWSP